MPNMNNYQNSFLITRMISFYTNGAKINLQQEFSAEAGMTWEEWVNGPYNKSKFFSISPLGEILYHNHFLFNSDLETIIKDDTIEEIIYNYNL